MSAESLMLMDPVKYLELKREALAAVMSGYHKDIQNGEEVDVRLAELQKNRPTRAHIINLVLNAGLRIADLDILSEGMILDIVTLRVRQFHHRDMQ